MFTENRPSAEHEFKQADFLAEVPLLMGTPTCGSLRAQTSCRVARLEKQQFHRLIRDSRQDRTIILETVGERLFPIQQRSSSLPNVTGAYLGTLQGCGLP